MVGVGTYKFHITSSTSRN